jgi:beta-lactam-binding protein with PASTA domain
VPSLGIVGYELLTDRVPFTGETPMAIAYRHLSDRVPPPSAAAEHVPPEFDAFIASATDPVRELRPESALAMRRDLATVIPTLERARTLSSLVNDVPRVTRDAGADTTAAVAPSAITQTIAQVQQPRRRRGRRVLVALLAFVTLAVAAWGAWAYVLPHSHPVPQLRGVSVEAASAQLHDLGFVVQVDDGHYAPQPRGTVASVDPSEGTSLREGETVTLVPSLGPPPVVVPDVRGETLEDAAATLEQHDLAVGDVKKVYDDRVAEGRVIRQSPVDQAPRGSDVELWISKGHAPVPVPAIVGDTQRQAEKALRRAGFSPVVRFAFSDDVERDRVISVEPNEATKTAYGSPVTITVSQGPETFPVPVLTGLSPTEAKAKAADYGLHVTVSVVPGTAGTVIISQVPAAGTTVHSGDTITLWAAA